MSSPSVPSSPSLCEKEESDHHSQTSSADEDFVIVNATVISNQVPIRNDVPTTTSAMAALALTVSGTAATHPSNPAPVSRGVTTQPTVHHSVEQQSVPAKDDILVTTAANSASVSRDNLPDQTEHHSVEQQSAPAKEDTATQTASTSAPDPLSRTIVDAMFASDENDLPTARDYEFFCKLYDWVDLDPKKDIDSQILQHNRDVCEIMQSPDFVGFHERVFRFTLPGPHPL
ncbi:hypothetical protein JCM3766R1_003913 [Sporobolomyces carnicolor]